MIKDDALGKRLNAIKNNTDPEIPKKEESLIKPDSNKKINSKSLEENSIDTTEFLKSFLTILFPCLEILSYGYVIKLLFMHDINFLGVAAFGIAIYALLVKLHSLFNKK